MEKLTQKLFIDKMAKSKEITTKELAEHLGLEASSLRVTLLRSNLMFKQFCKIYKYIYGSEFLTGEIFFDVARDLYEDVTLKYVVEAMELNSTPLTVTLYKKTKIQLINPLTEELNKITL